MPQHILSGIAVLCVAALLTLSACGNTIDNPTTTASLAPSEIFPPTPESDSLQVNATSEDSARLRVTIPSLSLSARAPGESVQVIIVLADPNGSYSFLLYPANRAGILEDQIALSESQLELGLVDETAQVTLWVVALHNLRYQAAEQFGIDSLATTLGLSFRNWLADGDRSDDPLAAIVAASDGALFEWFAAINVLGQSTVDFTPDETWNRVLVSTQSDDGGLNMVYSSEVIAAASPPAPTPTATNPPPTATATATTAAVQPVSTDPAIPGYGLVVDETFDNGMTSGSWYEGQTETYTNQVIDGAYEIQLTAIGEREFSQSWGSVEDQYFENYRVEAEVQVVEPDIADGRYGLWFNYQDDFNFLYFGISNRGEYRIALIARNQTVVEIQNWTVHPAINPGNASNVLTVDARTDGTFTLSANGTELLSFKETTFTRGSVAFFCYAKSVPATCRLEDLKIWAEAR